MREQCREYDLLSPALARKRVVVSQTTHEDLVIGHKLVSKHLKIAHADVNACEDMRQWRPDSQWKVCSAGDKSIIGYYFMIMLNKSGLDALLSNVFDPFHPERNYAAGIDQPVSAIFKWCIILPGVARTAIPILAEYLRTEPYRSVDIYANAATPRGKSLMESLSFRPIDRSSRLYCYQRLTNRTSETTCIR